MVLYFSMVMLSSLSAPHPATSAMVIFCVSPGAVLNGPDEIMKRTSASWSYSHPLPDTGSPEKPQSVAVPVVGSIIGSP